MPALTPKLLAHFARHHGIVTAEELRSLGYTERNVRTLRQAGTLVPVIDEACRIAAHPPDELARCRAICAVHPDVVISGVTAGRLWGLRRLPSDQRVHLIAPPHSHRVTVPWVRAYRTAAIHASDIVDRPDGIRVTSRARTALDLARVLRPFDLLSVIEQAARDGDLDDAELYAVAVDWISPRRPWLRTYLAMVERRLKGGAAESHAEVLLGDALAAAGVGGIERQYPVELPGYGRARFDLAVPDLRWAIEVDLFPTHAETIGRHSDLERDAAAAKIGWVVSRVGPDGFGAALDTTVERLRALHHTLRLRTA